MRITIVLLFGLSFFTADAQKKVKVKELNDIVDHLFFVRKKTTSTETYNVNATVRLAKTTDTIENRTLHFYYDSSWIGFGDSSNYQIENDSMVVCVSYEGKSVSIFYKDDDINSLMNTMGYAGLKFRDSIVKSLVKSFDISISTKVEEGYKVVNFQSKVRGSFDLPVIEYRYTLDYKSGRKEQVEVIKRSSVPQLKENFSSSLLLDMQEGIDYIARDQYYYFLKEESILWKAESQKVLNNTVIAMNDIIVSFNGRILLTDKFKDYVLLDEKRY